MELELLPTQEDVLIETLPGTEYRLTLTAINPDGMTTTPVIVFDTDPLGECIDLFSLIC